MEINDIEEFDIEKMKNMGFQATNLGIGDEPFGDDIKWRSNLGTLSEENSSERSGGRGFKEPFLLVEKGLEIPPLAITIMF